MSTHFILQVMLFGSLFLAGYIVGMRLEEINLQSRERRLAAARRNLAALRSSAEDAAPTREDGAVDGPNARAAPFTRGTTPEGMKLDGRLDDAEHGETQAAQRRGEREQNKKPHRSCRLNHARTRKSGPKDSTKKKGPPRR